MTPTAPHSDVTSRPIDAGVEEWPITDDGSLAMHTCRLDLEALLQEK